MSDQVVFEDSYAADTHGRSGKGAGARSTQKGIVGLLVKTKVAEDARQAERILIVTAIVCVVGAVAIFIFSKPRPLPPPTPETPGWIPHTVS